MQQLEKARTREGFSIKKVQTILDGHVMRLRRRRQLPLGPAFAFLHGQYLADALVKHRILKKYEVPVESDVKTRKKESMDKVLARDTQGHNLPLDVLLQQGPTTSSLPRAFRAARGILGQICKHFRPSYNLVFPTGESSLSSAGLKDLYFKLEDNKYWECSPASFGYVCRIFFRNVHMKRFVKKRYFTVVEAEFGWGKPQAARKLYERHGRNGFACFKTMMSALVTLRDTSRMTTVPKDNSSDRVITCEPFLTMICQLSVMRDLRVALKRETGLHLESLQDWHGSRIRTSENATIDLKNASNQVWLPTISLLFPPHVAKVLLALRTGVTEVDGHYHHFNMFAPMGCGLTFDVMTLILLSCARAFDSQASVFGDDVIIKGKHAAAFIELIEALGYEVNTSKSFVEGNFRESCGYFADVKTGKLITCFDFHRPENLPETIIFYNKLRVIVQERQCSNALCQELTQLADCLLTLIPRDAYRYEREYLLDSSAAIVTDPELVSWVWSSDLQNLVQKHGRYIVTKPVYQGALQESTLNTVRMLRLRDASTLGAKAKRVRRTNDISTR